MSGRAVVAVLGGMALLALVFTVAANAQQTETETEAAEEQVQEEQVQEEQQQAQEAEPADEQPTTSAVQTEPAEEAEVAAPVEGQIVEQPEGTYAASNLIGRSVYSAEGEDIGRISDLLVSEEDRIVGVVLGIGGFLGIGEKPIAVELERLSRTTTQEGGEQLMLNFTRAELEQAPQFVSLEEQRERQAAEQARQQQQQDMTVTEPAAEGQTQSQ